MPALLFYTIIIEVTSKCTGIKNRVLSICTKVIYQSFFSVRNSNRLNAGHHITLVIEAIEVAINNLPDTSVVTTLVVGRTVVITSTGFSYTPCTGNNSTVFCEVINQISIILILTYSCRLCGSTEVVPLTCDLLPAGGDFTELGVTIYTCFCIVEETGVLGLIAVDTVVTEVVVVTVDLLNAGKLFAVLIVSEAAILDSPAILYVVRKGVAILEGGVGAAEASAGFSGKIRILEGLKAVNLLVLRLLSEGVKSVSSKVCGVTESTYVDNAESAVSSPVRIILGSKLNALNHAKGICGCRINSSGLVDPVKLKSQGVGSLVESSGCKREVLVENIELADIYYKVIVEVYSCSNLGKYADTLCKLKEEAPSSCVCHICAGKHINEIRKLCGNRDLSHIDSEDVRGSHAAIDVNCSVSHVIKGGRVGNITEPSELTVAAGRHVEVEGILTLLEHVKSDRTADALILCEISSNLNNLNTGRLVTNEYATVDSTNLAVLKCESYVAILDCNRLVVIACSYGKNSVCTVNCIHVSSGEVNVLGNNNVHFGHTDDLAVKHHIDLNCTIHKTGEYAVFGNGSEAIVGNRPGVTLGKLGFVACRADTGCVHLNGSTDSSILVFAIDQSVIELGRAGSSRNHKK